MPSLARGQSNTPSLLNWFITLNGVMADAILVEFRIMDITAGLPGTQVFPASAGTYQRVDNNLGHFATGSYYAYNPDTSSGWTVPADRTLGTHRIEWRWQFGSGYSVQTGFEDFEVTLGVEGGEAAPTYITVADVRAEGLPESVADNAKVEAYIEVWQAFLERACRQWFAPRTLTMKFDGTDSDTIHLGVPIISVEYLKVNNSPTALTTAWYKVYNSRSYPDDRHNPRIKLVNDREYSDIFSAPISAGALKFRKGRQNQEIRGVFGYTEEDGNTPAMIKRALMLLVIEKLQKPAYSTSGVTPPPMISGIVTEEWTDGHRMVYAQAGGTTKARAPGLIGITSNQEILDIIRLYRAPIGIATPAHPSYG